MEGRGLGYGRAALSWGKKLLCRLCGPQGRYGPLGEATNILTLWEIEPSSLGSPDLRRVAIATTPDTLRT